MSVDACVCLRPCMPMCGNCASLEYIGIIDAANRDARKVLQVWTNKNLHNNYLGLYHHRSFIDDSERRRSAFHFRSLERDSQ